MSFFSRLFGSRPQLARPSAQAAHQNATWPFDQGPTTAAITTRQVLDGEKDVLVVVHYSDDHSWAFLCGTTDDKADGRVITMEHAVEIDATLRSIADLPPGSMACRESRDAAWEKRERSADV